MNVAHTTLALRIVDSVGASVSEDESEGEVEGEFQF